jgi:hypothetical protein
MPRKTNLGHGGSVALSANLIQNLEDRTWGGFMLTLVLRIGDDVHRTYSTTARGVDRLLFVNNVLVLAPVWAPGGLAGWLASTSDLRLAPRPAPGPVPGVRDSQHGVRFQRPPPRSRDSNAFPSLRQYFIGTCQSGQASMFGAP